MKPASTHHRDAEDRWLEQDLRQITGTEAEPADLCDRIVARFEAGDLPLVVNPDQIAVDDPDKGRRPFTRSWQVAACVLLGLAGVLGVFGVTFNHGIHRPQDPPDLVILPDPDQPAQDKPTQDGKPRHHVVSDPARLGDEPADAKHLLLKYMTDEHLPKLLRFKELQGLVIVQGGPKVGSRALTDRAFATLGQLSKLETIRLQSCPKIRGSGFPDLQRLPALKTLELQALKLGKSAILNLVRLRSLQRLALENCKTDDRDELSLLQMKGLREFVFFGSSLRRQVMTSLHELGNLRLLHLQEAAIDDAVFDSISRLPKLRSLSLVRCRARLSTAAAGAIIARQGELQVLNLNETATGLTIAATPIGLLRSLEVLRVGGGTRPGSGFATKRRPMYRKLCDDDIEVLASLPKLRILDLSRTTGYGWQSLRKFELGELEELDLFEAGLDQDTIQAVRTLADVCRVRLPDGSRIGKK